MTIDELRKRLNDEFPEVYNCILINGDWGIGKTHFFENEYLKYKEYISVSLFGLNNIEEFKAEISAKLNKVLNFLKENFWNKIHKNVSIKLPVVGASVSIPYWKTDIEKAITRKCKKEKFTVIIDDLERKSSNINMEDVLGIIETISKIKNIKIVIIANENEINENDRKIYDSFKEKVIQKVYNVNKYSEQAPNSIIEKILKSSLSYDKYKLLKNIILDETAKHKVNNLRTLEKGCKFIKLIMKNINLRDLSDKEVKDIIIASYAVVIEEVEKKYISLEYENLEQERNKDNNLTYNFLNLDLIEKEGNLPTYCIIKNYFNENFFVSNKTTVVNSLFDIYRDIDVNENFNRINKFYKDFREIDKTDNKDLFYLSEEDLKDKIKSFYNDCVLNVNPVLDVNNWFKKLNEIYTYASIIGIQNIFCDEEVSKAMNLYLEKLETKGSLFNLIDRHIGSVISEEKVKFYNDELNKKIIEKYYNKIVDEIIEQINKEDFKYEKIDRIFSIFIEDENKFNKESIIKRLRDNSYFILDLSNEISEEEWCWTHEIWENASKYSQYRDNGFEKCVKELLENSTRIGKYRIELLNQQYHIDLNVIKESDNIV